MRKSIVALAVSGAALASVPAYATEDPSVYGSINYAGVSSATVTDGIRSDLLDNGSYLGVKGESKVNDSLTALFKYELQFQADQPAKRNDSKGYNQAQLRQAFIGLKGDFGKVMYGAPGTIYSHAIQAPVAPMQYIAADRAADSSRGDTITYLSPSVNGLEMQVALQHKGTQRNKSDSTVVKGKGSQVNKDYYTGKPSMFTELEGNAVMAVLKYSADMFNVALGYDSKLNTRTRTKPDAKARRRNPIINALFRDALLNAHKDTPLPDKVEDASENTGVALTVLPMADLSVSATYENEAKLATYLGLAARYDYGVGKVYTAYQNVNPAASDKKTYNDFAAGVTYKVNSAMKVYTEVAYQQDKAKSSKDNTISAVGVNYTF
jgi:predicted porin